MRIWELQEVPHLSTELVAVNPFRQSGSRLLWPLKVQKLLPFFNIPRWNYGGGRELSLFMSEPGWSVFHYNNDNMVASHFLLHSASTMYHAMCTDIFWNVIFESTPKKFLLLIWCACKNVKTIALLVQTKLTASLTACYQQWSTRQTW